MAPTRLATLALALAVLAGPAGGANGAAAAGQCAAGGAEECEEAALLQRDLQRRRSRAGSSQGAPAVTFEGGGFKAHSSYVGVITAILQKTSGCSVDSLFKHATTLSTVSGGTWYISMLAYSPWFLDLQLRLTEMTPAAAGTAYFEEYLMPLINSLGGLEKMRSSMPGSLMDRMYADLTRRIDTEHGLLGEFASRAVMNLREILSELRFVAMMPSWSEFIERLLQAAQLDPRIPLSSSVNPWASGREWLVGTTLPSIGGSGPGTCANQPCKLGASLCSFINASSVVVSNEGKTSYRAQTPSSPASMSTLPSLLPARFSLTFDGSPDQDALLPFCTETVCGPIQYEYTITGGCNKKSQPAPSMYESAPLGRVEEYTRKVGRLPLVGPVAASSSFLAESTFIPWRDPDVKSTVNSLLTAIRVLTPLNAFLIGILRNFLYKILDLNLAVWTLADNESEQTDIFAAGDALWSAVSDNRGVASPEQGQAMARGRFSALFDGVYTDNTGVSHAVTAGHRRILAFIDTMMFWDLFSGNNVTLSVLKDGAQTCPLCYVTFPLFAEDVMVAMKQFEANAVVATPPKGTPHVCSVTVGTVTGTTVDSEYWGTTAGETVEILLVKLKSDVGIGGFDYASYGEVVTGIILALQSQPNGAEGVTRILNFLGVSEEPSACSG